MGKNTKKKFGKDGSTKFVLMHRSQQDADYGKEGASDLVLYPVDGSQLSVPRVERTFATSKDHVNGLGFANDGYDYEKHLRKIDEGATFVSRDGRVLSAPVLPREALASAESEHERQLEAITISHEFMDPDIRAAMFDVSYDGGELDDDFMQQVMAPAEDGSEGEGFDFDAHVAKLIERSQRVMGLVEEGEEEDVEDYGSEDDDDEEEKGSAVGAAEMAQLDRDFDKALLEYDSDECGALEDPEDDPTLQGLVAVDNSDVAAAMDEWLVAQEPLRPVSIANPHRPKVPEVEEEGAAEEGQMTSGAEAGDKGEDEEEEGEEAEDSGDEDYMPEYLAAKEVAKWDCETIVSTYSNLDNHPRSIKEPSTDRRRCSASSRTSSAAYNTGGPQALVAEASKRIVLSAKTGLPVGVLPGTLKGQPAQEASAPNKGVARPKEESKEDKKARKAAVKKERQNKRVSKTQTKASYKVEDLVHQKRQAEGSGRASVFRY